MGLGNLTRLLARLRRPITLDQRPTPQPPAGGCSAVDSGPEMCPEWRERARRRLVAAAERDAESLRRVWDQVGAHIAEATDRYAATDYVTRVQQHQPCEGYACRHIAVGRTKHCRCGNAWVCAKAGPLNDGTAAWS